MGELGLSGATSHSTLLCVENHKKTHETHDVSRHTTDITQNCIFLHVGNDQSINQSINTVEFSIIHATFTAFIYSHLKCKLYIWSSVKKDIIVLFCC